jgi:hypothetical protein
MILFKQNIIVIRLTLTSKVMNEIIERTRLYPAAEPETPEIDMVFCRCSRPDRCSAERKPCRPRRREEDDRQCREQGVDQASSRASAGHSPKT